MNISQDVVLLQNENEPKIYINFKGWNEKNAVKESTKFKN